MKISRRLFWLTSLMFFLGGCSGTTGPSSQNPETGRYSLKRYLAVAFGPDMPLPSTRDLRDWWAHQKWFLGKGEQPQFDRWTYWEKFDYMAVFWGVAVIGLSGLMLWFPEFFTKFLPGWVINVATIIHSDEALLATGFIFTIHFFNTHFRPDKFPMDPVIFTGRMRVKELKTERPGLYEELVESGELDEHLVEPSSPVCRRRRTGWPTVAVSRAATVSRSCASCSRRIRIATTS